LRFQTLGSTTRSSVGIGANRFDVFGFTHDTNNGADHFYRAFGEFLGRNATAGCINDRRDCTDVVNRHDERSDRSSANCDRSAQRQSAIGNHGPDGDGASWLGEAGCGSRDHGSKSERNG
jgi:hypothetical protein